MAIGYRADIDGLRALAIIPVVFFHAGFVDFAGGYVGVDVFFVISGFLITSIIRSDLEAGTFSFGQFYERRIRRLLPALVPVLIVTAAFAAALYPAELFSDFARSLLAFTGFSSNWQFLSQAGYFDSAAFDKPLLHTWSLSIEEQYYLVFPAFMAVVFARSRRWASALILAVLVASLAWSIHLVQTGDTDTAFYHSLARVWELMAGSLLALVPLQGPKNRLISLALRLAGLAMIIAAVFLYTPTTPFPGLSALLPVAGTVLAISAGPAPDFANRVLSLRPLVYVGRISYSLYLWHWPIFSFIKLRWLDATDGHMFAGILLALALSVLSYHFIEQPFRTRKRAISRRFVLTSLGSAMATSAAISALVILNAGLPQRLAIMGNEQKMEVFVAFSKGLEARRLAIRADICHRTRQNSISEIQGHFDLCLATRTDQPNILVMGDSHAADLYVALDATYPEANFLQTTGANCALSIITLVDVAASDLPVMDWRERLCLETLKATMAYLDDVPLDGIVLTSRGRLGAYSAESAASLLPVLADRFPGVPVTIFGPLSEFWPEPRAFIMKEDDLRASYDELNQVMNASLRRTPPEFEPAFRDIVQRAGVRYIDKDQFICPNDICSFFIEDGAVVFSDYGHWSGAGAAWVGGHIRAQFPDILDLFVTPSTVATLRN